MTDRELLELAAKAAGISPDCLRDRYDQWDKDAPPVLVRKAWNPLDSDGDALRLAVKLFFTTETCKTYAQVITPSGEVYRVFAEEVDNPLAATRRAIVRAAAEIGKGMK